MFRILIADSLPEAIIDQYRSDKIEIDNRAGISKDELIEALPEYDGLVVRSRTKVTADVLEHAKKLKVIGRAGAGVDNIDTKEATRRGIIVENTPGGNTIAATEHTIALILAALRNISPAAGAMKAESWDRKKYMGNELFQKTVGIIGLGKIGREVAKRVKAFETTLLGYDPILSSEMADRMGIKLVGIDELIAQSDVITIHAPKMPETINMINAERLKKCKSNALLINCARGGIVNEADLAAALDSGHLSMAAVDVFESEPPKDWTQAMHTKVQATPHHGASTREAQMKVANQILEQMAEYFTHNVAWNAVNFVSIGEKEQQLLSPYLELAERLGTFFSRIQPGRLQEVAIRFYGDIIELPTEPIAAHLMAGALQPKPDSGTSVDLLNMVNSLTVARDKGISIELSKKDQRLTNHTNLIACDFHTDNGMMHLTGTVYARDIYRLFEFSDYRVDADLADSLLIVENDDVPGIIGKVGTLLADKNINISHVSSGRNKESGKAVNIFNTDEKIDADLQATLADTPNIHSALVVQLDS